MLSCICLWPLPALLHKAVCFSIDCLTAVCFASCPVCLCRKAQLPFTPCIAFCVLFESFFAFCQPCLVCLAAIRRKLMLLELVWLHKHRYYWNSEVMHVLLNITKTIWAVCFGVPRLGPFLTPGRRLAIAWKCGLDCLMVSGLGELVSSTSAALHGPNRLPKFRT